MRFLSASFLLVFSLSNPSVLFAQDAPGLPALKKDTLETDSRKGWFWYIDPKEKEKKKEEPAAPPTAQTNPKVEPAPSVVIGIGTKVEEKIEELLKDPCASLDTWSASCGFVDPGDNFEFQSKQRDILLQQMSLRPDVPEAVEAAQRYMKWVIGKASQAANMWYFNLIQKPDLDPRVKRPISEFGLTLASKIEKASQVDYFRLIKEQGGVLFFFTRDDCIYCHEQAPLTLRAARTMGLRVINVPLDGICIQGIAQEDCANEVKDLDKIELDLQMVPTLYLYVPDNTWIRLNTGLTTDDMTIANAVNFFSAYRAAMLQGIDNGDGVRPSVSFNPEYTQATGVARADNKQIPETPSQAKMMEMMGMRKTMKAAVDAGTVAADQFRSDQK